MALIAGCFLAGSLDARVATKSFLKLSIEKANVEVLENGFAITTEAGAIRAKTLRSDAVGLVIKTITNATLAIWFSMNMMPKFMPKKQDIKGSIILLMFTKGHTETA